MTVQRLVVADFADCASIYDAAAKAKAAGFAPMDVLSPFPLEGLDETLSLPRSPIRWPMLAAALLVAACAYALEYWTSVRAYPFNSGARPPDSWPIFPLVPFEVGVLAAGVAGFAALLILCGLPRIDHPLLAFPMTERATVDRFVLVFHDLEDDAQARRLRDILFEAHAQRIEASS